MFLDGSVAPVRISRDPARPPNRRLRRSPAHGRLGRAETRLTDAAEARADHEAVRSPTDLRARLSRPRQMPRATGFPPANFKHSLTLFSKFFASFPHGTCSLSVSRLYLALDEIYHPFGAAISNNPTRQEVDTRPDECKSQTGFSPSMMPCSKRLIPTPPENDNSIDYNSTCVTC